MPEVWRPIVGWEGLYEVSNCGRVRSLDRWVRCKLNSRQFREGKIRVPIIDKDGYEKVTMSGGGKFKIMPIHRLVAIAFIPNPENLPEINHKDLDKRNNRDENLEWYDNKRNIHHAISKGRRHAVTNPRCARKLTIEQVQAIRKLRFEGLSYRKIGKEFGIHNTTVWAIVNDETWCDPRTIERR